MEQTPASPGRDRAGERHADAELVGRFLAGEQEAFACLVERYQRQAVGLAYRLVGNLHDALEIAQEAFLRAYRSMGALQKPERFGPWLMRIVGNLSLNFRRSRSKTHSRSLEQFVQAGLEGTDQELVSRSAPGEEASAGELEGAIRRALAELPEQQRLALILFAVEGWSQKDVAEVLDCSIELVKWNVFQARKTLRRKLADYL